MGIYGEGVADTWERGLGRDSGGVLHNGIGILAEDCVKEHMVWRLWGEINEINADSLDELW